MTPTRVKFKSLFKREIFQSTFFFPKEERNGISSNFELEENCRQFYVGTRKDCRSGVGMRYCFAEAFVRCRTRHVAATQQPETSISWAPRRPQSYANVDTYV